MAVLIESGLFISVGRGVFLFLFFSAEFELTLNMWSCGEQGPVARQDTGRGTVQPHSPGPPVPSGATLQGPGVKITLWFLTLLGPVSTAGQHCTMSWQK